MTRAEAITLGWTVPHPELGAQYVEARRPWNPSVGPSLDMPWWRDVPTLRLDAAGRAAALRHIAEGPSWMGVPDAFAA